VRPSPSSLSSYRFYSLLEKEFPRESDCFCSPMSLAAHCPYISLGEILTSNALSLLDEGESLLLEVTESSVTLGGSVLSFLFNSLGLRSTSSCNKTANLTPTSMHALLAFSLLSLLSLLSPLYLTHLLLGVRSELSGFNLYGEIPSLLGELPKLAQLYLPSS